MKVPIRYKSSDRYNAGVDVVYDDESKLQYAPFIYANTASGDNGGDSGDDEEGEDTMVVNINTTERGLSLDKTWQEIYDAVASDKFVVIKGFNKNTGYSYMYIDMVDSDGQDSYDVVAHECSESPNSEWVTSHYTFTIGSASGYPTVSSD